MKKFLSELPAIIRMVVQILALIGLLILWNDLDWSLWFKVIYIIGLILGIHSEWSSIKFKDK